jgi:hypothetical protein
VLIVDVVPLDTDPPVKSLSATNGLAAEPPQLIAITVVAASVRCAPPRNNATAISHGKNGLRIESPFCRPMAAVQQKLR